MQNNVFGTERISKLLLRLAPPIMFSQLIQAMYNIIDSYFVGQYSEGLAALSVLFPITEIITAAMGLILYFAERRKMNI